jgi:hypothetical protein
VRVRDRGMGERDGVASVGMATLAGGPATTDPPAAAGIIHAG